VDIENSLKNRFGCDYIAGLAGFPTLLADPAFPSRKKAA